MDNTELTHWGIKGMRWGVRRYQNADGTLTEKGKKRYDKEMESLKREAKILKNRQRTQAKMDKLDAKRKEVEDLRQQYPKKQQKPKKEKPVKKKLKDMTDAEIQEKIDRMNLEKKYRDLLADEKKANEIPEEEKSAGHKFVKSVWDDMIKPAGTDVGKQIAKSLLTKVANKAVEKKLGSEYKIHTNNKKKS